MALLELSSIFLVARNIFYLWATWVISRRASRWLHYKSVMRKNGCHELPRYPHKDPIFGLDLFLESQKALKERRFLDFNGELFQKYGKTFQANNLGVHTIKTMNPEVTKYVHATYFNHFGVEKIRSGVEYLWGDGITSTEGEKWATRRKLITPAFDTVHIGNLENRSLGKHVDRLMDLIPRDGSTIDLMPLFRRLSLDTASEFIFGESMNALQSVDSHKEFLDAYFYAQKGTLPRILLGPKLRWLYRDPRWYRDSDTVLNFIDQRVDQALARRETGEVGDGHVRLIDEMLKITQDRLTIRFQAQNVFTPAHDGAAITLSNAIFHLSRNPKAWEKLREEILPTKNSQITYDLLKTYQYLKNTIRETHRITPQSTFIARQCIREVILPHGGGKDGTEPLYLKEGDVVEMNFRATLRDKDFWGEDADQFRPERWDDLRPTWEYTPFGGGPRICPGFRLVFAEVAYTLVTILREFERLESRDDRPWTEETRFTFQNLNGAKVALIPARSF